MLSLNSQGISSKTGMVGMAGVFISDKNWAREYPM